MNKQPIKQKKVILGDEYDNALRHALISVLTELGGQIQSKNWGVGGSQEIETMNVDINGSIVTIEAETYIGLSISGEYSIVEQISLLITDIIGKK